MIITNRKYFCHAILAAALFFVFAAGVAAQEFKQVHPGVEYAHVSKVVSGQNVEIDLLRLDLKKVRLDVVHAMDSAIGTEKTSSIAARHGAIAAINAGFFRLDRSIWAGDAAGVLMVDGHLISESHNDRTAIFIRKTLRDGSSVEFAPINIGRTFRIGKREFSFTGIDRERGADDLIEYTPEFSRTTLTDSNGVEAVVSAGRIAAINSGRGSSVIPPGGFVISASGRFREQILPYLKIGQRVSQKTGVSERAGSSLDERRAANAFKGAEDITNGIPQLVHAGRVAVTWKEEKASKSFVETRHPRTAVAKLRDGKFLMITVDGRSESSGGIGLYDLADYLLSLGAVEAMNLDGGGSTTMYLDGKVVNHPSDKEGERKIGDAIIVTLRK